MPPVHLKRREFNRMLLCSAGAWALGCGGNPEDYTPQEAERLAEQMQAEAANTGKNRFGPLRFRGYRGLAELPWFELDANGQLRIAVGLPGIIDIHVHLGISLLFAPEIDLWERHDRTRHILDCDADDGCELDLDVYMNSNFTEAMHSARSREFFRQLTLGSGVAATQTAANLLVEMDAVGVERATILPIAVGLPFGDSLTERWMQAIEQGDPDGRLIPFASVHPRDGKRLEKLRSFAAQGARGIKLHPEVQRFFPDAPEAMEIYQECERLGLVVLFHAGRSGIEPERLRKFALMRRYVPALDAFPNVRFVFGHGGARDSAEAAQLAQRFPNLWYGLSSLGVSQIDELLRVAGPERLIFGSDWPFYHLGVTLAKLLIVTGQDAQVRDLILRGNALRVLAAA